MPDVIILPTVHPLDETGTLPENYVENEQRDLAARDVRAFATRFGAFFMDTFQLRDANGAVVPRTKFQFALYNDVLSAKIGQDVCAAVVITDKNVPSPVFADYHCVGGPFGASNEHILELFNQLQTDDRPVSWPNIIGKPEEYKPAHHYQDIGDLYGAEYWVAAMDRLTQAFLMGDNASHDEIWRKIDANYKELKDEMDGLVDNIKAYVDQQDQGIRVDLDSLNQRVTNVRDALQLADQALNDRITALDQRVTAHLARTDNPHQVTAAQTGAYTRGQVDALIAQLNNQYGNFVKKNTGEDLSLTISNGILYSWVNGGWRQVWPATWS